MKEHNYSEFAKHAIEEIQLPEKLVELIHSNDTFIQSRVLHQDNEEFQERMQQTEG